MLIIICHCDSEGSKEDRGRKLNEKGSGVGTESPGFWSSVRERLSAKALPFQPLTFSEPKFSHLSNTDHNSCPDHHPHQGCDENQMRECAQKALCQEKSWL